MSRVRGPRNETSGTPTVMHAAQLHGQRVVCSCGDFNCASLDYTACSFALGRGDYCKGDVRFPATHATLCPHFRSTPIPPVMGTEGDQ